MEERPLMIDRDNLIGYLRTDPKNTVTIRIHLHTLENNETEKIVKELNEIE